MIMSVSLVLSSKRVTNPTHGWPTFSSPNRLVLLPEQSQPLPQLPRDPVGGSGFLQVLSTRHLELSKQLTRDGAQPQPQSGGASACVRRQLSTLSSTWPKWGGGPATLATYLRYFAHGAKKLYSWVLRSRWLGSRVKAPSPATYKLRDLADSPTSLGFSVLICKARDKADTQFTRMFWNCNSLCLIQWLIELGPEKVLSDY